MGDVQIPPHESVDTPASRVGPGFAWWDRSAARTPMPWRAGPGGGFTTGRPWLRLGPDADARNVATQSRDPRSVLETYRRILRARREHRVLQDGAFSLTRTGDANVLGYRRHGPSGEALILVSFGPARASAIVPRPVHGGHWRSVVGTHLDPPGIIVGRPVELRPFKGSSRCGMSVLGRRDGPCYTPGLTARTERSSARDGPERARDGASRAGTTARTSLASRAAAPDSAPRGCPEPGGAMSDRARRRTSRWYHDPFVRWTSGSFRFREVPTR